MIGLNQVNFRTVVLPTAVTDLSALLQLLNDKKAYQKHLGELVKLTNEANEAIESVGKAKEINNLLLEAEMLNEEAKKKRAETEQKSDDIIKLANNKAALLVSQTQAKADELLGEAETASANAKKDWDDSVVSKKANENLAASLANQAENLSKREAKIEKVEQQIAAKKKLLEQL